MKHFISEHRDNFGVEPIYNVLQIAPSGYRRYAALLRDPHKHCTQARCKTALSSEIEQVWQANLQVCSADEVGSNQLASQTTVMAA